MEPIRDALLRAIEKSGQTRGEVAKASGVHEPTIYRFVVEGRSLSLRNADRLAVHFGLELVPRRRGRRARGKGR